MPLGTINVAVDHAESTLLRYLSGADLLATPLSQVRDALLSVVLKSGADTFVVRESDYWHASTIVKPQQIVVGMPDEADLGKAIGRLSPALRSIGALDVTIKLGFAVREDDVGAAKETFDQMHSLPGTSQFVAEPYFQKTLTSAQRSEWITAAIECPRICALKLDVTDPQVIIETYHDAVKGFPWYARSDGMTFEEFLEKVKVAKRAGCVGAIAGAAVWRSELPRVLLARNDEALRCMHSRVKFLRSEFQ